METSLLPKEITITLVVVSASLMIWAWRMLNRVWLKPRKLERSLRAQGLAGNPYRFLVGDMKELLMLRKEATSKPIKLSDDTLPRVYSFFFQHIQKYGKKSFVWFGPSPRVNIMNPEQIKDIFTKIGDFEKVEMHPLVKSLATGLAFYEGEKWAKHRKILNPTFHLEKLKLMLPVFHASCNEMITKWDKLASVKELCEIDVWPDLQNLTSDAISRIAFRSNYEEGKKIFQLQALQAKLIKDIVRLPIYKIPGWSFLPTNMNRRMKNMKTEIELMLRGIISKRMEAMKAGEAANDDLLGLLLESNMKEIQEHNGNKNIGMTLQDVIEECKLFYFVGQETTSILLVWTLILLSIHPQWQTHARKEILKVFGSNKPDFDCLSRLKIVTMILYEVLRLYPPVIHLSRTIHKETKLGELTLPAGVDLSLPVILIHRDEEFWGDNANDFKPDRFAGGVSKATKNPMSFLPFGWGPRICIGQNFAMIEAKLAIAMILQRYSFELSPSYAHAPTVVIGIQPQYGAQLILHRC